MNSGSTISAGLLCGFDKDSAVKFSFLLAVPAICGATLYEWVKHGAEAAKEIGWLPFVVGSVASFIFSVLAITAMLRIVRKKKLSYFSYYCIPAGAAVIVAGLMWR